MANQGSEARGLVRAIERLLPLTEGELEIGISASEGCLRDFRV